MGAQGKARVQTMERAFATLDLKATIARYLPTVANEGRVFAASALAIQDITAICAKEIDVMTAVSTRMVILTSLLASAPGTAFAQTLGVFVSLASRVETAHSQPTAMTGTLLPSSAVATVHAREGREYVEAWTSAPISARVNNRTKLCTLVPAVLCPSALVPS